MRRVLIALALLASVTLHGETCIESLELIPKQAAMQQVHGRYSYAVRVRVRPHPEHRLLVLSWDGGSAGAGSSRRALDGREAPITWTFQMRDVPAGRYLYVATVFDTRGKLVGRATAQTILVGDDDGDRRSSQGITR
jgi:hypothetical protein